MNMGPPPQLSIFRRPCCMQTEAERTKFLMHASCDMVVLSLRLEHLYVRCVVIPICLFRL